MAKSLTAIATDQIDKQQIKKEYTFKINSVDRSDYLLNWTVSTSVKFGSMSGVFVLRNPNGLFSVGGSAQIDVGDVVELIEKYGGDTTEWKRFYGIVNKRSIGKTATSRTITLNCLDYISILENWDIDLTVEGTRVKVEDEVLEPNYLDSPNENMAQLFNFANDSIATEPIPFIKIRDKTHLFVDPQFDGFEIYYSTGQLKLGAPLQVKDNYDLMATYYYYCYSSDTEVLTENGWKLFKDIVENKLKVKIATLNPKKNLVEYHYPIIYHKYEYRGKMLHQKGKFVDFIVTPDHNVYCRTYNKNKRGKKNFYFCKAKDLPREIHYRKDFPYEGRERKFFVLPSYQTSYVDKWGNTRILNYKERKIKMNDWLEFFGWWLAEGWVSKENRSDCSSIRISQSKNKNFSNWNKINKVIKRIGYKNSYYQYKNTTGIFHISSLQLGNYLKQFGKSKDKFIPREFLNLSKRQLKILLDALMLGDGSNYYYSTASKKLIDDVQELALKCGYSSNVFNNNGSYQITLCKKQYTSPNKHQDKREWINYNDYVYCLTVPNHLMYVRRNGKGVWSGNCHGVNVEDVLEQILTQEDGYCYSQDTEVLTENGWMLLKDIVENELKVKIATLNSKKNIVEYHYPKNYVKQKYEGKMLHQKGRRIDFIVTPNHNIWARLISTWRRYNKLNKYIFRYYKAKNLPKNVEYKKDFPYRGKEKEYFILPSYYNTFKKIDYRSEKESVYHIKKLKKKIPMDDWLRFFGIWLAEGWVVKTKNNKFGRICISQYEGWKQREIDEWINKLGLKYKYLKNNREFIIYDVQLATYLSQFGKSKDKFIPQEFKNLSKRQLKILLNALMLGDGQLTKKTKCYVTISKQLADDVQEIALKCGYSANLIKTKEKYYVTLAVRPFSMPNQGKDKREWIDYNDYVYCLTVPNHLMYVRRNGKGCWNGNSNYLFGESSAQAVIDNHLKTTFYDEEGTNTDTLTLNSTSVTLTIEHQLASDVNEGDTEITLDSVEGLPDPDSGDTVECSINGDVFTYTNISGNTLSGIPSSGSYSLKAHKSGDYVEYEKEYPAGQVAYLSYSNLVTTLSTSDFTLPSGVTVSYHNKRGTQDGSYIILSEPISLTEVVTCNTNYTFKTLQTTGVEINKIKFKPREVRNALEAINKLRTWLAPNYIIRTQGDNKIWASYLRQKTTEDYELKLATNIQYMEDEDLYTRVIMYGKNENPTNIMFEDSVEFTEEDQSYTGIATKEELYYVGEEKSGVLSTQAQSDLTGIDLVRIPLTGTIDESLLSYIREKYIDKDYVNQVSTGYHIYTTPMSNRGKIILEDVTPTVYINNVPVNNQIHQMVAVPIKIKVKTETVTSGNTKSKSVSVHTYYYYTAIFPHSSIVPDKPIYIYDSQGILIYTISANDPNMDYANGTYTVPGNEQNSTAESASTATYWVLYSTDKIIIDYDNIVFKIHKSILPNPTESVVRATFEYWDVVVPIREIDAIVDGRRDTQIQLEFFGEPPAGYVLGVLDLGEVKKIQAIDLIAGYFKPDDYRKYEMGCRFSLYSSTDGVNYSAISDALDNFEFRTGDAIKFEEDDLGTDFQARYIKIILQSVDRIDYGRGIYVVAIAEVAMYDDIILKAEAKLIPTTTLTQEVNAGDTVVNVESTSGFTEPESGETATAYIGTDSFTYTGLTSTSFTGCTIESGISGLVGDRVSQTLESSTTIYDDDGLLPKLGDRVYKDIRISDRNLYSQSELNRIAKAYLEEFYKNHTKQRVNVLFAPHLRIGQTVKLVDAENNVNDRFFIDSIQDRSGNLSLVLAKYP